MLQVEWPSIKQFVDDRAISIQYIETASKYDLFAKDSGVLVYCKLPKSGGDPSELSDFEANYKPTGNQEIKTSVKTQFEREDITVRLARVAGTVASGTATLTIPVPAGGRYLAGGWGILDTYNIDDYVNVEIYDDDRLIAAALGGLTDEQVQAATEYTEYPKIGSFDDNGLPSGNRGWYFWPSVRHDGTSGEVEFEPMGWYSPLPEGMYIKLIVTRPNVSTGEVRACIFWGEQIV